MFRTNSKENIAKTKRGLLSRFMRYTCYVLLAPIVVFVLLTIALYLPFVQDWASDLACRKLSEATGLNVGVERVRITPLLDVDLKELSVTEPTDGSHLLKVKSCVLDLDMIGLLGGRVGVDALDLNDGYVDSKQWIDELTVRGRLDEFHVGVHDIELKNHNVNITDARLKGCDVDIMMRDTTIVDTTKSEPLPWRLSFRNIDVEHSSIAFHTACDTMSVKAQVNSMTLKKGSYDLEKNLLQLTGLSLSADSLYYDQNFQPYANGLDYNHVSLSNVVASVPSVDGNFNDFRLCAKVEDMSLREKCGLEVSGFNADVEMDTKHLLVCNVNLKTPTSQLRARADMDWSALSYDQTSDGKLTATLSADLSRDDVMRVAGVYLPEGVRALYPDKMLTAEVDLEGTLEQVELRTCRLQMPGMLSLSVSGDARQLLDEKNRMASLRLDATSQDLSLVQRMFNLTGFRLPPMHLTGTAAVSGSLCSADLLLNQGEGTARLRGRYDLDKESYDLRADMSKFVLSRFVSMPEPTILSSHVTVRGRGLDIMSGRTKLLAQVDVPYARVGDSEVRALNLLARVDGREGSIDFSSDGDILNADGCVDFTLQGRRIYDASFALDVRQLDFYHLGLVKKPFVASMLMHINGSSNLADSHYAKGQVSAIQLILPDTTYYPKDIALETLIEPDTTFVSLLAGDLRLNLKSGDGVQTLMKKVTVLSDSVVHQVKAQRFDQPALMTLLPDVDLCVESGHENPLHYILMTQGYRFNKMDVDLHTNPNNGLSGEGYLHGLNLGSLQLDTICFDARNDSSAIMLNARVTNGKKNPDVTFDSHLHARISPQLIESSLVFYDDEHKKGIDLGANVTFEEGNRRIHLTPHRLILAYRQFTVNKDNFVQLDRNGRLDADLDLLADDGTGLKLFSSPNDEAQQDLTASLSHFNVGELCSVIPYMPSITGLLHGDVHLVKDDNTTFMADLLVQNLSYEGNDMGNVGLNAVYMPNEDGSHFVDGFLTQNDNQVLSFNGTYTDLGKTDAIDAQAVLESFPLELANGFLGEMVNLSGIMTGNLDVSGSTASPRLDGEVQTHDVHVLSPMYSINLSLQDGVLPVVGNILSVNKIPARSTGSQPLVLDGKVDFRDISAIRLNMTAKAQNFELINAHKTRNAAAYGKVYVNMDMRAQGVVTNLDLSGTLDVLGNTDVTYVLLDSPITVDDELSDLVTFCDFTDTTTVEGITLPPPSNINVRLNIHIDQAAQVNCHLSEDGVNYIKLEGGGDLTMLYDYTNGLRMKGRYNIISGLMTYNYLVLSLKDCEIENGSYVEFNGDVMNPTLNIKANERVKSTVTENNVPRSVAFDVGLSITQTLNNMGLSFILDAPEDLAVRNEIAQMTDEQRSRVAVTLMATGMYLVEGKQGGGFNTTDALNAFLQNQISTITGKALNSIDLSLGVHNRQRENGIQTDYSFRFAKHFWGNRISVVIGGKVSSGNEVRNDGQSIIDNISIEYRLDNSATRYVTLYYNTDNESILEGRILEMGAALVLRKSTDRLGELFLFRKKEDKTDATKEDNKE